VHQNKAILLLTMMQTMIFIAMGQKIDSSSAIIVQVKNNQANFSSTLRPLQQIAGAPEAFYSYYWEFGDGHFSFEENPHHTYKDIGTYDARLFATNNYDDGKPPPLKPKPVRVNSKNSNYAVDKSPVFFKQGGAIEMKVNCMPKADEDMVLIMGYRNENGIAPASGSMILFYNERQFRKNNFDISEERTYNNEKKNALNDIIAFVPQQEIMEESSVAGPHASFIDESPSFFGGKLTELIASKQKMFRQNNAWRFSGLDAGEEKYFFITLHTTPEMIKDTNAMVQLTGMFIPDNPSASIEEYTLELQIVSSHDPNRMILRNRRLSYRFTGKKKEMNYTVRFQNTGRGPSRQVTVAVAVPAMLDARSIEIQDHYPKCVFCKSVTRPGQSCLDTIIRKDSVFFIFKNIYLPGLRERGITDPDSTVGFVKYRMHFNDRLKKLPFQSNASIVFDNNKPIYTNSPKGFFKPGKSFGVIAGYNTFFGDNVKDENYFSVGAGLSPYSPYRKYLQEELFLGYMQFPERLELALTENKDTVVDGTTLHIFGREIYAKQKIIKLDLVPLQLRYNFTNWIGAGAGAIASFNAYTRSNNREVIHVVQQPNPTAFILGKTYATTNWFTNFDAALFADVQAGKVRVGPVIGVRYLHYFRYPRNGFFIYAAWRL
jgi:hypothetical protein